MQKVLGYNDLQLGGDSRDEVRNIERPKNNRSVTLGIRVEGMAGQMILVQGDKPVRSCARCVQHFPFLGPLPPPTDGWSVITDLYVSRYGVPKDNQASWIRTCQHIDGFIDVPKVFRVRVQAPTP